MDLNDKIYIAGHRGLVGSAVFRRLEKDKYKNIIVRTHSQFDLTNQKAASDFFAQEKPEYEVDIKKEINIIKEVLL